MSNSGNHRIVSVSLTEAQFYARLAGAIVIVLGVAWAAWAGAVGFVIEKHIRLELTPPNGQISTAIDDRVRCHEEAAKIEAMEFSKDYELRMLRFEIMLERVYEVTTDLPLPAKVGD